MSGCPENKRSPEYARSARVRIGIGPRNSRRKVERMALLGKFHLIPPDQWLFPNHGDVAAGIERARLYREHHGTYEGAEFEIEEFVRQWAMSQLLTAYKYPREW